jgi:hypothetical protein
LDGCRDNSLGCVMWITADRPPICISKITYGRALVI